jgi:predicted nucleotide-binding protein
VDNFLLNKQKTYSRVRFDSKTLFEAEKQFRSLTGKITFNQLSVQFADATWSYNTFDEFLAAADRGIINVQAFGETHKWQLMVFPAFGAERTIVTIAAPTRDEIESVSVIFEANAERCRLPALAVPAKNTKVFIGHGQDPQWRDLKDHLHEKHGYSIDAYEIGSRAGHTIRDILEEMLEASSFALLVMTGEDETKDGAYRARQNVVHEAGLFQGKLGFSRAIILLEDGTEEFSNIDGLQQIRFSKGNIKESFGDVLAVLKRELG